MTFIGIFMAYNMDSFLCWVCSVKGALEVQASFVNELLSVTASSPNPHLNVFELLYLCFPLHFYFLFKFSLLFPWGKYMEGKLKVQGHAPLKLEHRIARCIWESLNKDFWYIFMSACNCNIKLFSPTVKLQLQFLMNAEETWNNSMAPRA